MTSFNTISDKYSYYIVRIKNNNNYSYCLWSANNSNNNNEFLVSKENLIITFKSIQEIKSKISRIKKLNFKTRRFKGWCDILLKTKAPRSYTTYDFDSIRKVFFKKFLPLKINSYYLKEYINYVNLVHDYAAQSNNIYLINLIEDRNIDLLWEFTYDIYLWQVKAGEREKIIDKLNTNWDYDKFRTSFETLFITFVKSFTSL